MVNYKEKPNVGAILSLRTEHDHIYAWRKRDIEDIDRGGRNSFNQRRDFFPLVGMGNTKAGFGWKYIYHRKRGKIKALSSSGTWWGEGSL